MSTGISTLSTVSKLDIVEARPINPSNPQSYMRESPPKNQQQDHENTSATENEVGIQLDEALDAERAVMDEMHQVFARAKVVEPEILTNWDARVNAARQRTRELLKKLLGNK